MAVMCITYNFTDKFSNQVILHARICLNLSEKITHSGNCKFPDSKMSCFIDFLHLETVEYEPPDSDSDEVEEEDDEDEEDHST